MITRILSLLLISIVLAGCSALLDYPTPEQGNKFTVKQAEKLKKGMSKRQVTQLIGTPILDPAFNENRWDYVKVDEDSAGREIEQRVTLYFYKGRVARIEKHL